MQLQTGPYPHFRSLFMPKADSFFNPERVAPTSVGSNGLDMGITPSVKEEIVVRLTQGSSPSPATLGWKA
jgi:hypothetical protein